MIKLLCLVLISVRLSVSQDIFEITTRLDDPRFRFIFHGFRDFIFNTIGKTGQKTEGKFLQEKFPDNAPFPCDISLGRSKIRPNSIHKLRVGGESSILSQSLISKSSSSSCLDNFYFFSSYSNTFVNMPIRKMSIRCWCKRRLNLLITYFCFLTL